MKLKPYLSYWSQGYYKDKDQEFIKKLYFISASLLKSLYGEVHLLTDEYGKFFLKNIPFTSVDYALSSLPLKGSYSNWSLGKIKTYSIAASKGDPFIHIDADVFMSKKIPDSYFKDTDGLFSHKEFIYNKDFPEVDFFIKNLPNKFLLESKNFYLAPNFSFFYFKDLDFAFWATSEALRVGLDSKNLEFIDSINWAYSMAPALTIESIYFYQLMISNNKKSKYLFSDINNPIEAKDLQYIHLWGKKEDPALRKKIDQIYTNIV